MYLQTARRPNTQSLTQTRVPSKHTSTKHEEEEIVCQLSVQDRQKFIAKRQRHWHKDKDMHTKTKTHTQRQRHSHKDQAMSLACLGKPGRALWRARDADIPQSWGDSPCAKRNTFVHFISFFYRNHLPENQFHYADQREMGWRKKIKKIWKIANFFSQLTSWQVFFLHYCCYWY